MKHFLKFGLFAFLTFFAFSCSSDDSSDSPGGAANGEFVAKVDGTLFRTSTTVGATLYNGTFNITALNSATSETILITVSNASEGTFDLGPGGNSQSGGVYMKDSQNAFVSVAEGGSGSIKITRIDLDSKKVSGTFSFTGIRQFFGDNGEILTESVNITEGAFNNIELAVSIPDDGESTLSAKIDGVDLNADSVSASKLTFGGGTTITISANNNSTNQHLSLMFPSTITPGTYNFTGGFSEYVGFYNPNLGGGTNNYVAESGSLKIISYDPAAGTMEGTFSFAAKRLDPNDPDVTYQITNGVFSVEIQ